MANLFMINLIIVLWGVAKSETPHLFGGGCLMENQKLIMSGSFVPGTKPELSKESYRLDLTYAVTVPSNDTIEWSPVLPSNKLPGDLITHEIMGKPLLFYALGDFFKPKEKELKRRAPVDSDNAISGTSFFAKLAKMIRDDNKKKPQEVNPVESPPREKNPIVKPLQEESPGEYEQEEEPIVQLSPGGETPNETKPKDNEQLKPTPKLVFLSAPKPSNSTSSETAKPILYKSDAEPKPETDPLPKTKIEPKAEPTQAEIEEFVSKMYYDYLEDNLRIAIKYNDNRIYLDNLKKSIPIGSPLSTVTLENVQTSTLEFKPTTGDIPLNRAGFSAAQYRNYLYITGGQDPQHNSEGNFVYQLNLDNYTWTKFTPEGFRGAKSGCLYYSHPYLIHAFGMIDKTYSSTTQLISTKTWSKVQTYDPNPEDQPTPTSIPTSSPPPSSSFFSSSTTVITVSAVATLLSILSLSSLIFLFLRRRRRAKSQLTPPTILSTPVWSPMPEPQYQLDTTLISHDPNLFYDFKVAKSYSPSSLQMATGSTEVTESTPSSTTSTATSHPRIA